MKKISRLIAIALILTIGGVYATFTYANNKATEAEKAMSVTVAGKTVEGAAKGTIAITQDAAIAIDETSTGSLKTGATFTDMKITFTPNLGANDIVYQNGISLKMTITLENPTYEYKGTAAFEATTYKIATLKDTYTAGGVTLNGGVAAKEFTVDLSDYVNITEIFLSEEGHYDAYKAALGNFKIKVLVTEA